MASYPFLCNQESPRTAFHFSTFNMESQEREIFLYQKKYTCDKWQLMFSFNVRITLRAAIDCGELLEGWKALADVFQAVLEK